MKNKNRPYKYNSKSRLTNSNSFPFKTSNTKIDPKKSLENTLTKFKIIEEIPDETESLDNSFLEGRFEKKEDKKKKNKNPKKGGFLRKLDDKPKKVETSFKEEEKNSEPKIIKVEDVVEPSKKTPKKKVDHSSQIAFFRKMFLTLSGVCAIILIILLSSNFLMSGISKLYHSTKERVTIGDKKSSNVIDDNYLFVGGFHTSQFSFESFGLDYHYVNVGNRSLTTSKLLGDMKNIVYDYNPSVVFLELGMVDLNNGVRQEEILQNYSRIIQSIQSNRPNAIIYIESVYPINRDVRDFNDSMIKDDVTDQDITELNAQLKNLAIEKDVRYLDLYFTLSDNGKLDSKYSNDGVTLNSNGYNAILKEIRNIVG